MQRLAEAAPDTFLDAVEYAMSDPRFVSLFEDEGSLGCHHAGLLWALERLAWAPEYLTRVCLILASLVENDPPGQTYANHPLGSLRRIFLSWQPQTMATPSQRSEVLDTLRKRSSLEVLVRLLCEIMPRDHSITTGNNIPQWREWGLDVPEYPPNEDVHKVTCWAFDTLLTIATKDNVGWPALLRMLSELDDGERVIAALEGEIDNLKDKKSAVRRTLREVLHQHRQFSNVAWRLADVVLARLEAIYTRLEPAGVVDRVRWMFGENAVSPDPVPDDWEKEREKFAQDQTVAAKSILKEVEVQGLSGVFDTENDARRFGKALASSQPPTVSSQILAQLLDEASSVSRALAVGYYRELTRQEPSGLPDIDISSWQTDDVIHILSSLTPSQEVWDVIDTYGADVRGAYWKQCDTFWVPEHDHEAAVDQLLEFDRPFAAAALCALRLSRMPVATQLVARVLTAAAEKIDPKRETPAPREDNLPHDIAKLFRYVEGAPYSDDFIGKMELGLLAFLRFEPGRPRALRALLSRNPDLFSDLIQRTFPDEGESEKVGEIGFHLLHEFRWMPETQTDEAWTELADWYESVRGSLASNTQQWGMAKFFIGQSLADTPVGDDGVWPNEAIRELNLKSQRATLHQGS